MTEIKQETKQEKKKRKRELIKRLIELRKEQIKTLEDSIMKYLKKDIQIANEVLKNQNNEENLVRHFEATNKLLKTLLNDEVKK